MHDIITSTMISVSFYTCYVKQFIHVDKVLMLLSKYCECKKTRVCCKVNNMLEEEEEEVAA